MPNNHRIIVITPIFITKKAYMFELSIKSKGTKEWKRKKAKAAIVAKMSLGMKI